MPEASQISEVVTIPREELTEWTGAAIRSGDRQIALFSFPSVSPGYFALDQFDPIGLANVLARGILGDIDGEPVVASPLFKQHFSLLTGRCFEQPDVAIDTYSVLVTEQSVTIQL